MTMQHCPRCQADLPLDSYRPGAHGKPGNYCRACMVEYKQQWRRTRGVQPMRTRSCAHPGCNQRPASKTAKYCCPEHQPKPALSTTYRAVHKQIQRAFGRASARQCSRCSEQARDWAYDHTDPNELTTQWYGKTVVYSIDASRYQPLCRPCHRQADQPYEGSGLQRLNEWRRQQAHGGADPAPRPVTAW